MKKKLFVFILVFSILTMTEVFANAAEPPSIVVYTKHAPSDMDMYIVDEDEETMFKKHDVFGGTHYNLYGTDIKQNKSYQIRVVSQKYNYTIEIPSELDQFSNIFTLNVKSKHIKKGKSIIRSLILISLRVGITLVIEGFVFALFRFEENKSWLRFLYINLLTQGALNIWLNTLTPNGGYLFLLLIFCEVYIIIAELLLFNLFVKEHSVWYKSLYVVTANLVSLVIGGFVITKLPI